ncbi:hypothetical protein [Devosia alba]|uniref:hypothetical protein n=1 Tax=Devosia alba TaxID=3152360 RepID=UPI003264955F
MPKFKVAHLRQQGQDMVIVPLSAEFGRRTQDEQQEMIAEIQQHSSAAGLAGIVVPVWPGGGGRMGFIAPQPWHPFFRSMSLAGVQRNLNRELSW